MNDFEPLKDHLSCSTGHDMAMPIQLFPLALPRPQMQRLRIGLGWQRVEDNGALLFDDSLLQDKYLIFYLCERRVIIFSVTR